MKKIFMLMIVALAAVSVKAITVDEAFEKFVAIPGAAVSDVPDYDCTKEGMDWGKVVMLIGANPSTLAQADEVLADITDPIVVDEAVQGNNHVKGYAAKQEDGRTRAIICVTMPGNGMVIVYAQGGDDLVNEMNIN
ncbi:MAG: hypothetical protein HDS54_02705 [Barnesiella sp.]|nr:hypothetical protein [Barnesiella sp.]MBD5247064.1 hypothetical protein [Barnesiella sp.]